MCCFDEVMKKKNFYCITHFCHTINVVNNPTIGLDLNLAEGLKWKKILTFFKSLSRFWARNNHFVDKKKEKLKIIYLHLIADMIRLIHTVLVDFQFVHHLPLTPPGIRKASCEVSQYA